MNCTEIDSLIGKLGLANTSFAGQPANFPYDLGFDALTLLSSYYGSKEVCACPLTRSPLFPRTSDILCNDRNRSFIIDRISEVFKNAGLFAKMPMYPWVMYVVIEGLERETKDRNWRSLASLLKLLPILGKSAGNGRVLGLLSYIGNGTGTISTPPEIRLLAWSALNEIVSSRIDPKYARNLAEQVNKASETALKKAGLEDSKIWTAVSGAAKEAAGTLTLELAREIPENIDFLPYPDKPKDDKTTKIIIGSVAAISALGLIWKFA